MSGAFLVPEAGLYLLLLNAFLGLTRIVIMPRIGPVSPPILLESTLLLAVLYGALRRRTLFVAAPQHILMLGLTAWMVLSLMVSGNRGSGNLEYARNGYLVRVLYLFLLTNILMTPKQLKRLVVVLLVANVGLLAVSYLVREGWFGEEMVQSADRIARTTSLVHNPNTLAFDLTIFLIVAAASFTYVRGLPLKIALALLAVLDVAWILSTLSRSGAISLGIVLLFMFLTLLWDLKSAAFAAAVCVAAFALSPWTLASRFALVEDAGHVDRIKFWTVAGNMALHHPVFGVGLGNYVQNYRRYNTTDWKDPVPPHNMYLDLASQMGFPALVFYLAIVGVTWKRLISMQADLARMRLRSSFLYRYGWAVQICFVHLLVFGTSGDVEFEYSVFTILGLGMLLYREHQRRSAADPMAAATWQEPEERDRSGAPLPA